MSLGYRIGRGVTLGVLVAALYTQPVYAQGPVKEQPLTPLPIQPVIRDEPTDLIIKNDEFAPINPLPTGYRR